MTASSPAIGKSILTDGFETNYFDQGTGEPLLLLHGSGVGVSAHANWGRSIPVLATHNRVLAVDVAGFAFSDSPVDAPYGLDYWVSHIVSFLDALQIRSANILGNSFGGALAIALAARQPDRVGRVMLMGSAGVEFSVKPVFGAGFTMELSHDVMKSLLQNFTFSPDRITDEMVDLRLQTALRPETKARQSRLFPGHREERVKALLTPVDEIRKIGKRFLIVHGRDDIIVPTETSFTLHNLIADSDLQIFGRCGHWSQLDRFDEFHNMATAFFASRGG